MRRCLIPLALAALALNGCGSNNTAPAELPSSTSSSPSATPSETAGASPSVSESPLPQPTNAEPTSPAGDLLEGSEDSGTAVGGPSAENDGRTTSLSEFLSSGGKCFSDYFPAGPLTDEAMAEVLDYCASQSTGTEPNGYQRPEADENGYVGPSEEYYNYDGYVEPGFEYQVGSECFEPSLGRCKTSGEIQSEHMAEQHGGTL